MNWTWVVAINVIVTTGGGLYRYQLRDEIEVVGFLDAVSAAAFCRASRIA